MAKRLAGLTPKKRNPQDVTQKHDLSPVRRRVADLEVRVSHLEEWAASLFNPSASPKSFERRKATR